MRTMALSMMNPDLPIIMAKSIIGGHVLLMLAHKPTELIVLPVKELQTQVGIVPTNLVSVLL